MPDSVWVALIGAAALLGSTWLQRRPSKTLKATKQLAEKAVENTENVSNGFAQDMRDTVQTIVDRIDNQDQQRHRRDAAMNMLIAKLDDRLVKIEEKL